MTTQLTNPITQSATHVTLDGWELVVHRNSDLSVNTAESYLIGDFAFRRADGTIVNRQRFSKTGTELPNAVKTAIANLQTSLLNAARTAGIVPAGSDTPDF